MGDDARSYGAHFFVYHRDDGCDDDRWLGAYVGVQTWLIPMIKFCIKR